jgi:ATP-dependent helicase/nuclease subunit B
VLAAPGGPFTLSARADRIDVTQGGLVITDYKTGALPADARVNELAAPQLPLEAAIANAPADEGGFEKVPKVPVAGLRYVRASGAEPPGEQHEVDCEDVGRLAAAALEGVSRLIARFDDAGTPYRPMRRPRFSYDYDDYAHLARVAEWSATPAGGEEG